MTHRRAYALAVLASLAFGPARADYVVKDGNTILQTIEAFTHSGKILPKNVPTDVNGAALDIATNATLTALVAANHTDLAAILSRLSTDPATQTTLAAVLAQLSSVNHIICDSGCGGGGGGLSVAYGGAIGANGTPGGFKDGSGFFQPFLGDSNGLWVSIKASAAIGVTGTFWQATQPVSAVSWPLPTNAAQETGGNLASLVTQLGAVTASPTANTISDRLKSINTTLGSPYQAGGALPLPSGAATSALQTSIITALGSPYQAGGALPLPSGAATSANQSTIATNTGTTNTDLGAPGAVACASDTASCSLNQLLQRVAQRISSVIALLPTSLGAGGGLKVDGSGTALPVSAGSLPLPSGAATSANQTNASQKTQIVDGSGNVIASTSNNLNVQCANCSGSGVSTADEATFTAGTSLFAGTGGFFQTSPTANPLTTGKQGMWQMTANRAGFVNLRDSSANELGIAATPLRTDPTGTTTQPVSGTVTANAGTNTSTAALALETGGNLAQIVTDFGAPGATACTTDTASCNQNQQLQRLAQRLTSIVTALGSPFQAGGSIGNTSFGISGTLPAFASTPTFNLGTLNGAATAALQPTNAAIASTTSAQTGHLMMGAVTTAAPAYTTAQTNPLSLDTGGNLRINCVTGCGGGSGGTASNFGSAFPAAGTAIGLTNGTNMVAWSATTNYGTAPSAIPVPAVNASVTASALPTGAATAANQATEIASLATIASNTGGAIPAGTATIGKVGINDGTNSGTVKAASTGAAFTDTALVADPRPNSAATISGTVTNPSSTITLPAATTLYGANTLVANSATAGSVVNPFFTIPNTAGGAAIPRIRLSTNDTVATGWPQALMQIDLWTTTPTWTNGDRAAWLPATGAGAHLASYTCQLGAAWGDGIAGECYPTVGSFASVKLASGTSIFWSLQTLSGTPGVVGVSKVWTAIAEFMN